MFIAPTVGRVVLYRPSGSFLGMIMSAQPMKADVVHVNDDGTVNLFVVDHHGQNYSMMNIRLVQPDEPKPEGGNFCHWMDYQVGQAKKHADKE